MGNHIGRVCGQRYNIETSEIAGRRCNARSYGSLPEPGKIGSEASEIQLLIGTDVFSLQLQDELEGLLTKVAPLSSSISALEALFTFVLPDATAGDKVYVNVCPHCRWTEQRPTR